MYPTMLLSGFFALAASAQAATETTIHSPIMTPTDHQDQPAVQLNVASPEVLGTYCSAYSLPMDGNYSMSMALNFVSGWCVEHRGELEPRTCRVWPGGEIQIYLCNYGYSASDFQDLCDPVWYADSMSKIDKECGQYAGGWVYFAGPNGNYAIGRDPWHDNGWEIQECPDLRRVTTEQPPAPPAGNGV